MSFTAIVTIASFSLNINVSSAARWRQESSPRRFSPRGALWSAVGLPPLWVTCNGAAHAALPKAVATTALQSAAARSFYFILGYGLLWTQTFDGLPSGPISKRYVSPRVLSERTRRNV